MAFAPASEDGIDPSLSKIVTNPAPSKIDAFVGSVSVTLIVSEDSTNKSSDIGMVKDLEVWPGVKVNIPLTKV